MKNFFISGFAVFMILFSGSTAFVNAQDTIKKPVVKKAIVKLAIKKPATIDPATGKPINLKTGRPYTKWGYGSHKYNAAAAHKADSLKNAAALKVAATPPVVIPHTDTTHAQAPADKSLKGQYQYLLTKVYNYQQPLIAALWKNVIDTLKADHNKLTEAQAKAAAQDKTITGLQADVAAKDQLNSQADEISLLGASLPKSTYNLIMWGLVVVLGAIAAIVIARSGKFKYDANYRTNLYNELEEEFKTYKTKANDKEKKLARELQTERNKVDELMGR